MKSVVQSVVSRIRRLARFFSVTGRRDSEADLLGFVFFSMPDSGVEYWLVLEVLIQVARDVAGPDVEEELRKFRGGEDVV